MVVGIDVTHPSPGSASHAPSVARILASIDWRLEQWPADLRVQASCLEKVDDLDVMLKSRFRLWKQKGKHQSFPENILIYHDGVSEGQYGMVVKEELESLQNACKEVYPNSDKRKGLPRITIVIVDKRHHTRFYPTQKSEADKGSNTKNGIVVDRGVTEARNGTSS